MTTLEEKLGYSFKDVHLLQQALTHKSFKNENQEFSYGQNERLEFLGDAVLDLVLSDLLYKKFPDLDEGHLSKLRASLVNEGALARMARDYELDKLLRLGRGERQSGGSEKPRLLASAIEAVFGALYLDADFKVCFGLVERLFGRALEEVDLDTHYALDFKTRFQEVAQKHMKLTPVYEVINEAGPDHQKIFHVRVQVGDKFLGEGRGKSKKEAEQEAAKNALEVIDEL